MSEVKRYDIAEYGGGMDVIVDGTYVGADDFDRVTAERDAALGREAALARELEAESQGADRAAEAMMEWRRDYMELQQRLTAADKRVGVLEQALKFYAEREHYHFESGNWDTVSGEPLNILWNGDEPDFIEDGSIARAALKPAECCTVSAEDRALLDAGDYTPEELFGIGGKPSCPKCAR